MHFSWIISKCNEIYEQGTSLKFHRDSPMSFVPLLLHF